MFSKKEEMDAKMRSPNFYAQPKDSRDEAKAIEEDFMSVLLSPPQKVAQRSRIEETKKQESPDLLDTRLETRQ